MNEIISMCRPLLSSVWTVLSFSYCPCVPSAISISIVASSRRREDYVIFEGRSGTVVAITVLSSRLINLFYVVYEHARLNYRVPSSPWYNDQNILRNFCIVDYHDLQEKSYCLHVMLIDARWAHVPLRNRNQIYDNKYIFAAESNRIFMNN